MRYIFTDEIWNVFGPLGARCRSPHGPEPGLPDRMFFEAVLCPWRDLPSEFGDWSAVYNRLRRWIHSGRLKTLFELMAARPECEGPRQLMIDSTIVRAISTLPGRCENRGSATQAIGHPRVGSRPKSLLSHVTRTA